MGALGAGAKTALKGLGAVALPALDVLFAASVVPDLLHMAEDFGFDPTGRRRRGGEESVRRGLFGESSGIGRERTRQEETLLSSFLQPEYPDPLVGTTPRSLSVEARNILGPDSQALRGIAIQQRPSLTSLLARAGL